MIIDSVKSFERYITLHKGFEKVYKFLKDNNIFELPEGEYEIDGKIVYCTVSDGMGRGFEDYQLEVHDAYIDIHLLLSGTETIGFKDRSKCESDNASYDEIKDIALLPDEAEVFVTLGEGNFAVCFPRDAHAPLLGAERIKKAIFKVKV